MLLRDQTRVANELLVERQFVLKSGRHGIVKAAEHVEPVCVERHMDRLPVLEGRAHGRLVGHPRQRAVAAGIASQNQSVSSIGARDIAAKGRTALRRTLASSCLRSSASAWASGPLTYEYSRGHMITVSRLYRWPALSSAERSTFPSRVGTNRSSAGMSLAASSLHAGDLAWEPAQCSRNVALALLVVRHARTSRIPMLA
jgi:hypothetical protein